MKIITICGSMRFKKEMIEIATKLELDGNLVIQCVYFQEEKKLTSSDLDILGKIHYRKIEISDAIYVVNVNGYIGESTKKEIDYAHFLNKEVLFLEPFSNI